MWSYDIARKLSVFITLFSCQNDFMPLIRWIFIKLLMLVAIESAWGLSGARLLYQSSSGHTVAFNLGLFDGVKEGDFAVIVKEIRDLQARDLRLVPVARAKNIKLNTQNSIWILYKIFDPELLVNGQSYLILTESLLLRGRRDPKFSRLKVVTDPEQTSSQINENLKNDRDRIAKLKDQYPEIATLHTTKKRWDHDGEILDVEGWKKFGKNRFRTSLYKSPYAEDFRRELRLATFEKLVTAYLTKVNDPKFNYDAFYDEQMKSNFANEFRKRPNFATEYEKFLSIQSQKAIADAKLYRSILEKGQSWSEDFSDEELRLVMNEVSVLQERDRRQFVIATPTRYTTYLVYGMNLTDAQTEKDIAYQRDNRYSGEIEFEGTPILKHETLERFTLHAAARTNSTAYDVGSNVNASVDEISASAGLNWYPVYPPHGVEVPALFLGTYVRSGTAGINARGVNQKANYTVLGLPAFRGGMKYNFRNKFGLRIFLSLETLTLDRFQQSQFGSVLSNEVTLTEAKMNFALSYSF